MAKKKNDDYDYDGDLFYNFVVKKIIFMKIGNSNIFSIAGLVIALIWYITLFIDFKNEIKIAFAIIIIFLLSIGAGNEGYKHGKEKEWWR